LLRRAGHDVRQRVMSQKLTVEREAFRCAEGGPSSELPHRRFAGERFAADALQEVGGHVAGHRWVVEAAQGLDGQPHGDVGGEHEDLPADDAAGPLELRKIGDVERARAVARRGHDEAVRSREGALPIDELLELLYGDRGGMLARDCQLLALSC